MDCIKIWILQVYTLWLAPNLLQVATYIATVYVAKLAECLFHYYNVIWSYIRMHVSVLSFYDICLDHKRSFLLMAVCLNHTIAYYHSKIVAIHK